MLYSALKVFHHRDRLDALRRGRQPAPAQVQMIITNRCNHNCHFCSYRMPGYTSNQRFSARDEIDYAKAVEILDDCVDMGVGAVQITGGGEPTIHPQFTMICRDIQDRGLDLAVVTNGTAVPDEAFNVLAKATWVRFSVDAGTPATYQSVRRVGASAYGRTWENIRRLVAYKRELQTDLVIGVGFVVTRENYGEVVQATLQARDAGVDNIRISAVFQSDGAGYFEDIYDEAETLCRSAAAYQTPDFTVFNNFDSRFEDLSLARPNYQFCGIQHFDTYIGADLNVYRCCVQAYNRRGLIGSIAGQRFRELWESDAKREDFAQFDARGCQFCMFNEKNRTIAYAIEHSPPHVNFV